MNGENWYKADNAAKIFLATHTDRDTRSLRVSCTLNEAVDAWTLEEALRRTIAARSTFQVRIRRGFFWHYIEHTNTMPRVSEEHDRPCPVLYGKNYSGVLHYSVTYYGSRINLEVFHGLSDGTGAMEFLNVLVLNYLKIKHPDVLGETFIGTGASAGELEQDSFSKYYEKRPKGKNARTAEASEKAYHIRGLKLPYDQLQFMRVQMSSEPLHAAAKELGVSLTSYMCARLMLAIYRDMPALKRNLPVTISVPVNLRNFYSSDTSRNFFNSVNVSHVFSGSETVESLAAEFDAKLKAALAPENIHKQMVGYQRLEHLLVLRMVPLFIKQPVIRLFAKKQAKKVSAVFSNLGVMKVPEPLKPFIKDYGLLCSHSELYVSACTYNGTLTLGITSPLRSTGVLRDFISGFAADGADVLLDATEVIK